MIVVLTEEFQCLFWWKDKVFAASRRL